MKIRIAITVLLMNISIYQIAFAWEETVTHMDLSRYASEVMLDFSKSTYLKDIGLEEGLKHELVWGDSKKTIKDWIAEGGKLEDAGSLNPFKPQARFKNHFHNPLNVPAFAGLNDVLTG